jgi:hypothetical protein
LFSNSSNDPPAMGIIMPKVGKAFWVFDFSSLGVGIGEGGGSSSLGVRSGAWLAACEGAKLVD